MRRQKQTKMPLKYGYASCDITRWAIFVDGRENCIGKCEKQADENCNQRRNATRRDKMRHSGLTQSTDTCGTGAVTGPSGNGTTSTSTDCKTNNPTNELKCRVHVEQITIPIPSTLPLSLSFHLSLSQVAGDDVEVGGKSLNWSKYKMCMQQMCQSKNPIKKWEDNVFEMP